MSSKKLTIGYFYPDLLNLYGDDGNVQILLYRAKARGIDAEVTHINVETEVTEELMDSLDIIFMGGGPDSSQKGMYRDLLETKGNYLKEYVEEGGVGLYICGSYQLFGKYYKSADGSMLDGLGIFNVYTKHFGNHKPRCIGNVVCEVEEQIKSDPLFKKINMVGNTLVGFENHGGRTYLEKGAQPFAKIVTGHGNNSEDSTEGVIYKNSIGTYLHGPILARNPHLADYLIAKSLGLEDLDKLDDELIISAHTASKKLKQ